MLLERQFCSTSLVKVECASAVEFPNIPTLKLHWWKNIRKYNEREAAEVGEADNFWNENVGFIRDYDANRG